VIWLVQLVFDGHDPDAITRFWGQALEYRLDRAYATDADIAAFRAANPQFEGRGRIDDGELRRSPVYIQRVPEPKRGPNRVRLEVAVAPDARSEALTHLLALGAKRRGEQFVDVEGNEFILATEEDLTERRLRNVVFDALDPDRLLEFWSQATGYEPHDGRCEPADTGLAYEEGQFRLGGRAYLHVTGMDAHPGGTRLFDLAPGIAFARTSRAKGSKNRLHLDLTSTDAEADRERIVALGATVLQWDIEHVLADPEGNEFCLLPSRSPG
jgi:hypothetical protein